MSDVVDAHITRRVLNGEIFNGWGFEFPPMTKEQFYKKYGWMKQNEIKMG